MLAPETPVTVSIQKPDSNVAQPATMTVADLQGLLESGKAIKVEDVTENEAAETDDKVADNENALREDKKNPKKPDEPLGGVGGATVAVEEQAAEQGAHGAAQPGAAAPGATTSESDVEQGEIVADGGVRMDEQGMPIDGGGRVLYEQVPVAQTVKNLYEDNEMTADEVAEFIQGQKARVQSELSKVDKKKPSGSDYETASLFKAAKAQWQQAREAAQAKADYWQAVEDSVKAAQETNTEVQTEVSNDVKVSDELDNYGNPFVLNSNGNVNFGIINKEQAEKIGSDVAAPIRLPRGDSDYGHEHMQKHLEQLRQNGYNSVEEFVEDVSNNYDEIRQGNLYTDPNTGESSETFLLVKQGEKGDVLYVDLSPDGAYYKVNSGGVFKNSYIEKRNLLWNASTERSTTSGEPQGFPLTQLNPESGNVSALPQSKVLSSDKVTTSSAQKQTGGKKPKMTEAEKAKRKQEVRLARQMRMRELNRQKGGLRYLNVNRDLGEPQTLEEYVIREIAVGSAKFIWDGKTNGTGGLKQHGGAKKYAMLYTDNAKGVYPETWCEDAMLDLQDNYPQLANGASASDLLSIIESLAVGEQTPGQMMEMAVEMHKNEADVDAEWDKWMWNQLSEDEAEFWSEWEVNNQHAQEALDNLGGMSETDYERLFGRAQFVGDMFNEDGTPNGEQAQRGVSVDSSPRATERQARAIASQLQRLGLGGKVSIVRGVKAIYDAAKARLQAVYHGSGADFNAFDFSFMGTGEGAQVYGWGGYVTEVEEIGKAYAEQVKRNEYKNLLDDRDFNKNWIKRYNDIIEKEERHLARRKAALFSARQALESAKAQWDLVYDYSKSSEEYISAEAKFYEAQDSFKEAKNKVAESEAVIRLNKKNLDLTNDKIAELTEKINNFDGDKDLTKHLYHVEIPNDNGNNYLDYYGYLEYDLAKMLPRKTKENLLKTAIDSHFMFRQAVFDILFGNKEYATIDDKLKAINNVSEYVDKLNDEQLDSLIKSACEHFENTNFLFINHSIYDDLKHDFGSAEAASKFLSECGYIGISYPANDHNGGRADNARNYVIFKESDMKITDHIRFAQDEQGEIAGATLPNGDVILNSEAMRLDTPFHEFAHKLFTYAQENPQAANLYAAIRQYAENAPQAVKDYVKQHYPNLQGDAYLDEVFAWALSNQSEGGLEAFLKSRGIALNDSEAQAWYEQVWNLIKQLWAEVRPMISSVLGKRYADLSVFDAYEAMSVEDTGKALFDLMMGGRALKPSVPGMVSEQGVLARRGQNTAREAEAARRVEEEAIEREAKANGTWLKAPNGKDSHLSPKQWVQVRTKAFKDWFGDWELAKTLNLIDNIKPTSLDGIKSIGQKEAEYIVSNMPIGENIHDGRKVLWVKDTIGKILRHTGFDCSLLIPKLKEVYDNSVRIISEKEVEKDGHKKHPNFEGYHHYVGKVKLNGVDYYVRFTLQEVIVRKNDIIPNQLHSTYVSDVEIITNAATRIISGNTPVIANDGIKLDAKLRDFLKKANTAQENLSKMVDENGEPQVFYHNTDNEFTVFDEQLNGTNTDAGWLGDGFYFYGVIDEGYNYGKNRMPVFLNIRDPYYASSEENEELALANNRDKSIAFRERVEDDGYDGVYYNGDLRQEAVVFRPSQIKSATDNVGSFSEANPDIRFQFVGSLFDDEGRPIEDVRFRRGSFFDGANADGVYDLLSDISDYRNGGTILINDLEQYYGGELVEASGGARRAMESGLVPFSGTQYAGVDGEYHHMRFKNADGEVFTEAVPFTNPEKLREQREDLRFKRGISFDDIVPPINAPKNSLIGRSATKEEAETILANMQALAEPTSKMELNIENWVAQFGKDGMVNTPIGAVRLDLDQYKKMNQADRNTKMGMIKHTLENPDIIVADRSEARPGKETERNFSYIFVKAFINEQGERSYFFTSVSNMIQGEEKVVSNQEKEWNRLRRIMENGRLAYIKRATLPPESGSSIQGNQPALQTGELSNSKGTQNFVENQRYRFIGEVGAANLDKAEEAAGMGAASMSEAADESATASTMAAKRETAERLSRQLGVRVQIEDAGKGRNRRYADAKGWYDVKTGTVNLILGNHEDAADVERSILHEVVGHKGLRALMERQNPQAFDALCDRVYASMSEAERAYYERYAAEGLPSGATKEAVARTAAEEYMAFMAEVGGDRIGGFVKKSYLWTSNGTSRCTSSISITRRTTRGQWLTT